MRNDKDLIKEWNADCSKALVGKTIKSVRYMTDKEMKNIYGIKDH
jgi:hypothetical protein